MLADTILSAAGSPFDDAYSGAVTAFAESIRHAERFVFSPETMAACSQLAGSKPSSILEALPMCRAPFQRTWFEWDANIPLIGGRPRRGESEERPIPSRFGVMVDCLDDTHKRIGVSFAWEHRRSAAVSGDSAMMMADEYTGGKLLNLCPVGYVMNWHDKWPITDLALLQGKHPGLAIVTTDPHLRDDPKESRALDSLADMIIPTFVPHCHEFLKAMQRRLRESGGLEYFKDFLKSSNEDIEGEFQMLFAALCLLNSKNCVAMERADLSTLNRRRGKSGKKPLLSYSTVKINLSRRDARAAKSAGLSGAEIRKHIVRGHFKLRRGGVYWWRPFIRGNPKIGEVRRSGYNVVNEARAA